ncbi:MAG TPA: protein-L-isoaspartate(D-aspartate) O-methyltransferase [Gemmatimonadota bacterium]|nr:protein-L-isoaspartate(D-aspartate) O-methyltransferase [Gemmatimonadota bacterium]
MSDAGDERRPDIDWDGERERMVRHQVAGRGVRDPAVLSAMRAVPRHEFVPAEYLDLAYADRPLPIGAGQTISQPYIVAYMTEAAEPGPDDRVLEIGTGSGYQAAVLAEIVARVVTLEISPLLARRAARTLRELGYRNVAVVCADGRRGLPGGAPFDAILLAAAPVRVPDALVEQLAVDGRMVGPVGGGADQVLRRWTRRAHGVEVEDLMPVRFVPMTGEGRSP